MIGRLDHQIKVGGVRIDIGELEACLQGHPDVHEAAARAWKLPLLATQQAAVEAVGGSAGMMDEDVGRQPVAMRTVLVAYVVMKRDFESGSGLAADLQHHPSNGSGAGLVQIGLKAWVQQKLPPAAVPADVVALASLPRNPAGKVIRSQLPCPTWMGANDKMSPPLDENPNHPAKGSSPPAQATKQHFTSLSAVSESNVMAAFVRALGRRDLEPTDDFFAAGKAGLK